MTSDKDDGAGVRISQRSMSIELKSMSMNDARASTHHRQMNQSSEFDNRECVCDGISETHRRARAAKKEKWPRNGGTMAALPPGRRRSPNLLLAGGRSQLLARL